MLAYICIVLQIYNSLFNSMETVSKVPVFLPETVRYTVIMWCVFQDLKMESK